MAQKRNKPQQKHLEKFSKEEIIKLFSDKVNAMPEGKLMGFTKHFPFFDSDNYETLQFTIQSGTEDYVQATLDELEGQIKPYEQEIKDLKAEFTKEQKQKEEDKKKVERIYNQIEKNRQNYIDAFKVIKKEEELKQKSDKIQYKEDYLKGIKENIEYHKKVLKQ